jgi:hypothetical protein
MYKRYLQIMIIERHNTSKMFEGAAKKQAGANFTTNFMK